MNIDDFIKERETPYSKIKDVKINKDGTVSYTEIYNLKHPMCPITNVCGTSKTLVLNNSLPKNILKLDMEVWESKMKRPEFTKEQEYWLCEIIGDWYLYWKSKIADYDNRTHSLGYAKEQLKALICDDKEFFQPLKEFEE